MGEAVRDQPGGRGPLLDAAEAAGRVVEGFMWRHHPQIVLGFTGEEADAYRIEFAVV